MVAQQHAGNRVATEGASLVVIGRDAVLMVERARAPSKGLWSFPAGRAEPGEDPEANARRELMEETRLHVGPLVRLGTFHPPPAGAAAPSFSITVFAARALGGVPVAGDDAARAEFVPFSAVLTRPLTPRAPAWIARAILALADPPLL